jgi:hypothetical protein
MLCLSLHLYEPAINFFGCNQLAVDAVECSYPRSCLTYPSHFPADLPHVHFGYQHGPALPEHIGGALPSREFFFSVMEEFVTIDLLFWSLFIYNNRATFFRILKAITMK